jgi:glycosyltransferase involved in cell wall biosynthesis
VTVVSAVVCTRNRPEAVVRAVRSLLLSPEEELELLVVDQSDGRETENALSPLLCDPRLRYYRSKARGKGAALNEGIRASRGDIIVCTDDDCEAPTGWVVDMASALRAQPSAVIAFCSVIPVPHDESAGYVPAYRLKQNRLLRSVSAICGGLGIGAGMALRRDFAIAMGGFDEAFGPGARFPSADEWDIAMRALLTGHHVFETAELSIVHDGFRTFKEGRVHARRDWIALGAMCAKPLRALRLRSAIVPLWLFSTRAVWPPIADALHLRKPRGLIRIVAFVEGFGRGLCIAVDPATLRYV